jgi:primosomal protein N' (replication factor Y)
MSQTSDGVLRCRACATERPVVCQVCGGTAVALIRQGVTRAREELEALVGEVVGEVGVDDRTSTRVSIGTEALLHRVRSVATVVFLEFDQELFAPRYRAAEEAFALLARSSRLVGGRRGTVVVQTRAPEHEVLRAALLADPSIVSDLDAVRRRLTRFPPAVTMAVVGGQAAPGFVEAFGDPAGVEILGGGGDDWILVAEDRRLLLDALAATRRPPGRMRLQVDPMRVRR